MPELPATNRRKTGMSRRIFSFVGFATSIPVGLGLGYLLWKYVFPHARTTGGGGRDAKSVESEPPKRTAESVKP